jgi:restriction system protein
MAIPDYQTLMLPVLRVAARGETRAAEVEEVIVTEFGLTTEEREQLLPSGRQRLLYDRMQWAKYYLTRAGLLESPRRGRFLASEAGQALLAQNPTRIDVKRLLEYPAFAAFYRKDTPGGEGAAADLAAAPPANLTTPEEQIETAVSTLQNALSADLLSRILENTPTFFEQVIVDLLVAMGYGGDRSNAARRLGKSHDGGVDGVIDEDRLGLDRIYVQAKRYAQTNSVQRPEVQGFVGSLVGLGAHKGVFVTTSGFSQGAIDYASHLAQRVILIDGQRLAELMIEHNVGVRVSRTVEVKRLDEDFFADEG